MPGVQTAIESRVRGVLSSCYHNHQRHQTMSQRRTNVCDVVPALRQRLAIPRCYHKRRLQVHEILQWLLRRHIYCRMVEQQLFPEWFTLLVVDRNLHNNQTYAVK